MRNGLFSAGDAFKEAGNAIADGAKTAYNKTVNIATQQWDKTKRQINTLEGVFQVSILCTAAQSTRKVFTGLTAFRGLLLCCWDCDLLSKLEFKPVSSMQ